MIMAAATTLLIAISYLGGAVADYALYSGVSVLEQLLFSLYMVMLSDYLTAREMTRFSTRITVSLSAGAMAGGTLAGVLADRISPSWLLFGMPMLLLGCYAHLTWLARRWQPAGERTATGEGSVLDSLRQIGKIMRGVNIAALLSAAVFLNIAAQCVSEYMVFGIYAESFPDEGALASFFGLMSGALNLAAVIIGLGLTEPLMRRLGIARMNLFFPMSLAISFVALLASPVLVVAMFAHVVYDGFSNNVDAPVMTVNYNAVPGRFVGQVRVFNDSLVYPVALVASGLVIMLVDALTGVSWSGRPGDSPQHALRWRRMDFGPTLHKWAYRHPQGGSGQSRPHQSHGAGGARVAARQRDMLNAMLKGDDPAAADIALRIVANADIDPFREALVHRSRMQGDHVVMALARAGDRHAAPLLGLWGNADALLRIPIAQYLSAVGHDLPGDVEDAPVFTALALA